MGVAYKLRQDIVDFIVQTKRTDHSLSCRGLVKMIKDKFNFEVSKSSVNAVLKQARLSGPIGRHSIYKAPKNFAIPQHKKDILLKNVQMFLPAVVPAVTVPAVFEEVKPKPEMIAETDRAPEAKPDQSLNPIAGAALETGIEPVASLAVGADLVSARQSDDTSRAEDSPNKCAQPVAEHIVPQPIENAPDQSIEPEASLAVGAELNSDQPVPEPLTEPVVSQPIENDLTQEIAPESALEPEDPFMSVPERDPGLAAPEALTPATANSEEPVNALTDDRALRLMPDPVFGTPSFEQVQAEVEDGIRAREREEEKARERSALWLGNVGKLYGRLGAAALWYAFQAACSSCRLGEALARELGALPEGVTSAQCEAVLFADMFAEHRPGFESNDLSTLWRLAGLEDRQGRAIIDKAFVLENNKTLCTAIHTELTMAFTPVKYFRLLSAKGARFYLDAALPALNYEFIDAGQASVFGQSPAAALPIFMAVERAVDSIITNMQPVMANVPAFGLQPELLAFIRLMDGRGEDVFGSLELIGDNDTKCAEFLSIPAIRRDFILRVRLSESEMARVEYEMIDNHRAYFDPIADRSCGYFEGALAVEGADQPLRVLTVKPEGWGEEFVLLSNIPAEKCGAEDIFRQLFNSTIASDVGCGQLIEGKALSFAPQIGSISAVIREVDVLLRKYFLDSTCQALSWLGMCHWLYDLSGYIQEHPDTVFLRFQLPEDYAYQPQLTIILSSLNAAFFKTADGRRIVFTL
ncbi:MAG: hypothetical protein HQL20_01345 [Candidatus Omnitrophica bacterium]|nr:hypothetical protein [Candidatus Omnitrophota bacterium]